MPSLRCRPRRPQQHKFATRCESKPPKSTAQRPGAGTLPLDLSQLPEPTQADLDAYLAGAYEQ